MLPNMVVLAPAGEEELRLALDFAAQIARPIAMRYPRDTVHDEMPLAGCHEPFALGKSVFIRNTGADIVLIAYGSIAAQALEAALLLEKEGIAVDVINARFAKPIDAALVDLAACGKRIVTVEEHSISCGFGSALLEAVSSRGINADITLLGGPDSFVKQDTRSRQLEESGISGAKIAQTVRRIRDNG
jgi:1-deoxy-D-xylulose-5-phosphate synthase